MSGNFKLGLGLTEREVAQYDERRCVVCLVAVSCAAALLITAAGWLIYLACCRWQTLAAVLPQAGMFLAGAAAALVSVGYATWRIGHAGC